MYVAPSGIKVGDFGTVVGFDATGHPYLIRHPFGLTWQGPDINGDCSKDVHEQLYRWFFNEEPPPGSYANDLPSVSRPPPPPQNP